MRHFLNLFAQESEFLAEILQTAKLMKSPGLPKPYETLRNRIIALIFEKPSLRTRVSFEAAVTHLGGRSLFISGNEVGLGTRESICDFARTMSQYVDGLVMRVFKQHTVEETSKFATIPVINGLSDLSHPCQVMGDFLTIQELFGDIKGKSIVFVGDGNNVSRSLAVGCAKLGLEFTLVCPEGYGFDATFAKQYQEMFERPIPPELRNPDSALPRADIIYTDVWTSMGQEAEQEHRLKAFRSYQVNDSLLKKAPKHVQIFHCLPAHREEEITHTCFEKFADTIFQQAGNRLHAQKAILHCLFAKK